MQQSSIPGRMEAISMEEYLNRRKEMKEKKKEAREKTQGRISTRFFFSVWHEIK